MDIKIGNLNITSFCCENVEHIKFRNDLKKDELIYDFVSTSIEKDLHEVDNEKEIEIGNSYIIKDKDKLVGYVYFLEILNKSNIIELRYAVHPEYRRLSQINSSKKGYGQMILEECSDYLFTKEDIDTIELHIRDDNKASIGCAVKAKYKCIGKNNEEYYYIYRKSKNDSNI